MNIGNTTSVISERHSLSLCDIAVGHALGKIECELEEPNTLVSDSAFAKSSDSAPDQPEVSCCYHPKNKKPEDLLRKQLADQSDRSLKWCSSGNSIVAFILAGGAMEPGFEIRAKLRHPSVTELVGDFFHRRGFQKEFHRESKPNGAHPGVRTLLEFLLNEALQLSYCHLALLGHS